MRRREFLARTAASFPIAREWLTQARGPGPAGAIAETTAGRIRGSVLNGVNVFKGVPYGASTEGARRFTPPARPEPWTGVRNALAVGPRSPQDTISEFVPEIESLNPNEPMGEDCLRLNLWTAGLNGKRPVFVWVHAGSFMSGSGAWPLYDGAALASTHDLVVVTLNHRLHVLGDLRLSELGVEKYARSSNLQLQDLVAALEWVRDNIARFGGDPGAVTIAGEGQGGTLVLVLMAMPAANGLFHRAVAQSAPSLVRANTAESGTRMARQLLQKLDVSVDRIDELQRIPVDRLLASAAGPIGRGPRIDGHTLPVDPFGPMSPPVSARVPLLVGTNATAVTAVDAWPLDPMDDVALRANVQRLVNSSDNAEVERLVDLYKASHPTASNTDRYLTLASDANRLDVIPQAEAKAAAGGAPAYMYYFAWKTPVRSGLLRTPRMLEIPFAFDHPDLARSLTGSGRDRDAMSNRVSAAWAAFARTGNPSHNGLPKWPAYGTSRATMILDNDCSVVNDPAREALSALRAIRGRPRRV